MTCPVLWTLLRKFANVAGDTELMDNLALQGDVKSGILQMAVALDVYNNLKPQGKLDKNTLQQQMSETYKRHINV